MRKGATRDGHTAARVSRPQVLVTGLAVDGGSLDETINHIVTCFDLRYVSEARFHALHDLAQEAHRVLNGYIGYVRRQQQGVKEFGKTVLREERVIYVVANQETVDE